MPPFYKPPVTHLGDNDPELRKMLKERRYFGALLWYFVEEKLQYKDPAAFGEELAHARGGARAKVFYHPALVEAWYDGSNLPSKEAFEQIGVLAKDKGLENIWGLLKEIHGKVSRFDKRSVLRKAYGSSEHVPLVSELSLILKDRIPSTTNKDLAQTAETLGSSVSSIREILKSQRNPDYAFIEKFDALFKEKTYPQAASCGVVFDLQLRELADRLWTKGEAEHDPGLCLHACRIRTGYSQNNWGALMDPNVSAANIRVWEKSESTPRYNSSFYNITHNVKAFEDKNAHTPGGEAARHNLPEWFDDTKKRTLVELYNARLEKPSGKHTGKREPVSFAKIESTNLGAVTFDPHKIHIPDAQNMEASRG